MQHQMRRHARITIALFLVAACSSQFAVRADGGQASLQDAGDPALRFLDDLPKYTPATEATGALRLWGHGSHRRNFMGRLFVRWAQEFSQIHPAVQFENRMYGTASAVGALYTGAGEIALLGEEISPSADRAFRRARGYAPTIILVATGSLDVNYFDYAHMIFVHQDNPVGGLSLQQLDAIFGAEHRNSPANIRTWGELGLEGQWADRSIQPHGWQVDVDFALFFRERVMGNSHRWNPQIREYVHIRYPDGSQYDHGQQILDALARNPSGIAISNIRYSVPGVRAVPLAWTEGGEYVDPDKHTLIDQSYPLVRLIPAVIDREPGEPVKPNIREFLLYVLSREGQTALVEETGYLPLGPVVRRQQLELLQ